VAAVPAFIAASYVLNYSDQHNINPIDPGILFYEIDTVTVKNVLTFDQISEMLQIPMDELIFLNPWFKQRIIPATPEHPYSLRLKKDQVGGFINNEAALYTYRTRKSLGKDSLMTLVENSYRPTQSYVVRSGDNMASIAKKFHMTTSELKALNNLSKNYVKSRQRLLVYTPNTRTGYQSSATTSSASSDASPVAIAPEKHDEPSVAASSSKYHVVKSGENLNQIAGKYGCTVSEIMDWNHLSSNKILVGQKIKVEVPAGSSGSTAASKPSGQASSKSSSTQGSPKYTTYTIQLGDNLWDIAQKYDVTVAQIKEINKLTNSNKLKAGQKIKIPSGK